MDIGVFQICKRRPDKLPPFLSQKNYRNVSQLWAIQRALSTLKSTGTTGRRYSFCIDSIRDFNDQVHFDRLQAAQRREELPMLEIIDRGICSRARTVDDRNGHDS